MFSLLDIQSQFQCVADVVRPIKLLGLLLLFLLQIVESLWNVEIRSLSNISIDL